MTLPKPGSTRKKQAVRPLPYRFWEKVERGQKCWLWRGALNNRGYGQVNVLGRPTLAHRVAWELARGEIQAGLCVLHHCDTPACVRPSHLFLGTHKDNAADMIRKGRKVSFTKLTAEQVREVRSRTDRGAVVELAKRFGQSVKTLYSAKRRETWRDLE